MLEPAPGACFSYGWIEDEEDDETLEVLSS